ncbi:MAG: excinuclease ABC subunit UvrC [Anaerolineaceae bacterium]|nr:excinuclease ABC subunit UvrC [Anaerolineaceae bacterium]MBN2678422.1 excinuclease ABC subunit UvrC [Anaerolineaceae bacterium]
MEKSDHIQGILKNLPDKPGCYIMKDNQGRIIYVGKAINLRNRVRSYFHAQPEWDAKTRQMVEQIADIEWIIVGSELEALILEMNLIKLNRPHYNIRLKDDKHYPYIKVRWGDAFPKVIVTRELVKDGSRYFGPYTSVWAVHQTLDAIRRIFPYLTCDREITGQDPRPCLYFDIKLCAGPCIGVIQGAEYRQMIDDLCQFLEGRSEDIIKRMNTEMEHASKTLHYEKAAALRDQIQAIERVVQRQKVFSADQVDSDVIAMAKADNEACVQVFFIRSGRLIGREYFVLEGTEEKPDQEVLTQFIKQYYDEAISVPPQVMLPSEIEEANIIQQWLQAKRNGAKTEIIVPHVGLSRELVQMASENAVDTLQSLRNQWHSDRHRQSEALAELQKSLFLVNPPNRIECYDISNIQGTAAVASMVVFEQGVPNKKHYRHFDIKTVDGPDDFASMEEVLNRRFRRWRSAHELNAPGKKADPSFSMLPDLVIVDGGKGQLSRAVKVLEQYELGDKIPLAGLAKQNEEVFLPGRSHSVMLPRHSPSLYLVQRIRDEAHRFAIRAHRNKRSKLGLVSRLDSIPGIGPSRRKALIKRFGSLEGIRSASIDELSSLPGITKELAGRIKDLIELVE